MTKASLSRLHADLLDWYDEEKRDLPWRQTTDPYAIWVSEIMLQQTQVATVLPYFDRWMRRFPTVEALAAADDQDILSAWQGLGYYRRCRMLLSGARYVKENGYPVSADGWLKVPGVGRYTAGAIASIAGGHPTPLVDGNVERVFARLTACTRPRPALTSAAWIWAKGAVCRDRPGDWNQALMELGARICKPAPSCAKCPIQEFCKAHAKGLEANLPFAKVLPQTIRHEEIVWIPYHNGLFGLKQIPEGRWWHGMWEFPRAEHNADPQSLSDLVGEGDLEHAGMVRYQVTNHKIQMRAELHRSRVPSGQLSWHDSEALRQLPMPAPQRRALKLARAIIENPKLL